MPPQAAAVPGSAGGATSGAVALFCATAILHRRWAVREERRCRRRRAAPCDSDDEERERRRAWKPPWPPSQHADESYSSEQLAWHHLKRRRLRQRVSFKAWQAGPQEAEEAEDEIKAHFSRRPSSQSTLTMESRLTAGAAAASARPDASSVPSPPPVDGHFAQHPPNPASPTSPARNGDGGIIFGGDEMDDDAYPDEFQGAWDPSGLGIGSGGGGRSVGSDAPGPRGRGGGRETPFSLSDSLIMAGSVLQRAVSFILDGEEGIDEGYFRERERDDRFGEVKATTSSPREEVGSGSGFLWPAISPSVTPATTPGATPFATPQGTPSVTPSGSIADLAHLAHLSPFPRRSSSAPAAAASAGRHPSTKSKLENAKADYNAAIMPTKVCLIRHGQSEGNVKEELYATTPDNAIHLTKLGWQQARAAGLELRDRVLASGDLVHFVVSPYARTVETFHGIVAAWCDPSEFDHIKDRNARARAWYTRLREMGVTWHEDPRIREQDFGNYQDPATILKCKRERHRFGAFYYRFPHGESASDVYDRVSTFLDSLWRSFDLKRSQNYVLVTHGISIRILLSRYFRYSIDQFNCLANPKNCDVIVLGHDGRGRLRLEGRHELVLRKGKAHKDEGEENAEGEDRSEEPSHVIEGYKFAKTLRVLPKKWTVQREIRLSMEDC